MNENSEMLTSNESEKELSKTVDVVVLHKQKMVTDSMNMVLKKHGKTMDAYNSGREFLKHFEKYPKDMKIGFGYDLEDGLCGKDIAEKLHDAGYTNFTLLTGWRAEDLEEFGIQDYLPAIHLIDTPAIMKFLLE
jgi:hypothetical protein